MLQPHRSICDNESMPEPKPTPRPSIMPRSIPTLMWAMAITGAAVAGLVYAWQ